MAGIAKFACAATKRPLFRRSEAGLAACFVCGVTFGHAQNHSLIKDLKLCVRSFLPLQSLLRLLAWLLARKPLTKLVKLQTQWLQTLKQTQKQLKKLLVKLQTQLLKLLLTLLKLLKAQLKKLLLTQKKLLSNLTS